MHLDNLSYLQVAVAMFFTITNYKYTALPAISFIGKLSAWQLSLNYPNRVYDPLKKIMNKQEQLPGLTQHQKLSLQEKL